MLPGAAPAVAVVQDPRAAARTEITLEFRSIEIVQRNGQFGIPAVLQMFDRRFRFAVPAGFLVQLIENRAVAVDQVVIKVFFVRQQEKFERIVIPDSGIAFRKVFLLTDTIGMEPDME